MDPLLSFDLGGGTKMEFVLIQPGTFMMGDAGGYSDEVPVHQVKITKPFYLGKYEVTQKQWEIVMGANPSRFTNSSNPVENVSWANCQTFVKKLDERFAASGATFSLPTEAQWEYACRAGDASKYGVGNDESALGDYAWFDTNANKATHPVGEKKPNAWGLHDMQGNVWEWCADWYDAKYYSQSLVQDPAGPSVGVYRLVRGGGWNSFAPHCRPANRLLYTPTGHHASLGLRAVCKPQ